MVRLQGAEDKITLPRMAAAKIRVISEIRGSITLKAGLSF